MKQVTWAVVALLMFAAVPVPAQQSNPQAQDTQPSGKARIGKQARTVPPASPPACKDLRLIGAVADSFFGEPGPTATSDTIWDTLINCANQTHSQDERAEAVRVAAMWEHLRANGLYERLLASRLVAAPACRDLDKLEWRVKRFYDQTNAETTPVAPDYEQMLNELTRCARESRELNKKIPQAEEARAQVLLISWDSVNKAIEIRRLAKVYDELLAGDGALVDKYNSLVRDYNNLLEIARQSSRASDSYIESLQRAMLLQSVQRQPVVCDGTSYSYGKWGTVNLNCR
jgi:peroxiredoxin